MFTIRNLLTLCLALGTLLLAGCRGPLAVNRALVAREKSIQNPKLFGVWLRENKADSAPVTVACVYPLGTHQYLIEWYQCKREAPVKPGVPGSLKINSTCTFIARLSAFFNFIS